MSVTVDCGEGKHDLCTGTGRTAYLFPQESRGADEPPFSCGCLCHHGGDGVPCTECIPDPDAGFARTSATTEGSAREPGEDARDV